MATVEENGFTGRDLRIKLFDLMKSKGIVDNVKTTLRDRLIRELRSGGDGQIRFSPSTTQPTLLARALNALILSYFQGQKYEFTASVFIPEANINDYKIMSDEEILRLLNISTESNFYRKIKANAEANGYTSLLMSMLTCISSWLPGSSHSSGTQTSNDLWTGSISGSTLDEKLNSLDAMYNNRRDDLSSMHNLSTEEKLLMFQKGVELKTQETLRQQMDQFRANETKRIRDEERSKCQMELQILRKELETQYQSKQDTLNEKEMRIGDRFKAELENEKRELFAQRQSFLEELKAMKNREIESQRNLELRERSLALETDRIKRLEEDIRKREVALSNVELHVDQQVQMKLNKLRLEMEQQFIDRNKSLQLMELRNQEEARRLGEERLAAEQAKLEAAALRKHYSEADSTIHRLQSEVKVLQNENEILREKTKQTSDYHTIREENAVLKSQMEHTTKTHRSHRNHYDSGSSSPHEQTKNYREVSNELKNLLENRHVGQKVVNDELIDLKTQIALLQSSNEPEPYLNGRFPSNAGGDYLSRLIKSASDVQLNQSRISTSSNYNQFIEDARLRMHELDREADKVEESYRDYQHRIMNKSLYTTNLKSPEIDYSSGKRMPSVKLSGQMQSTVNDTIPASASLQDINSQTNRFMWNRNQPLNNLPESFMTTKTGLNDRRKTTFSQSNDRIFEHPEVTIKPALDDKTYKRLIATTKTSDSNEVDTGSAPNILEHPDMKKPIVMDAQKKSLSSSSGSSININASKLIRQQSADAYSMREPTTSLVNREINQMNSGINTQKAMRSSSPVSSVDDMAELPEQEKNDYTNASTPQLANKGATTINRQYVDTSSASDVDSASKHSNKNKNNHQATQSEEDDFW